jgi:hypothetical protein
VSKVRKEEVPPGAATHDDYSTSSRKTKAFAGSPSIQEAEDESYSPPGTIGRHLKWRRGRETWGLVMTFVVSLITLAVITAQAIIYQQQRKIMDQQVQQSERSLRLSERAYVSVASLTPDFDRKEVLIMIENIGKVPARNVNVEAHAYRQLADQLSGSTKYFDAGGVQLFPGSLKMAVVIPMPNMRPEEAKGILTRTDSFYVAGTIKYEDGFGGFDKTNFAYRYNPPPNERWTADSDLAKQLEKLLVPGRP